MTRVTSSTVSGRKSDSWNSGGTDVNDGDGASVHGRGSHPRHLRLEKLLRRFPASAVDFILFTDELYAVFTAA